MIKCSRKLVGRIVFILVFLSLIAVVSIAMIAWLTPKKTTFLNGPVKFLVVAIPVGIDVSGRCELRVTDGANAVVIWKYVDPPIRQYNSTVVFIGAVVPSSKVQTSGMRVLAVRWPGPVQDITLQVEGLIESSGEHTKAGGQGGQYKKIDSDRGILELNERGKIKYAVQFFVGSELKSAIFDRDDVDRWINESRSILLSFDEYQTL